MSRGRGGASSLTNIARKFDIDKFELTNLKLAESHETFPPLITGPYSLSGADSNVAESVLNAVTNIRLKLECSFKPTTSTVHNKSDIPGSGEKVNRKRFAHEGLFPKELRSVGCHVADKRSRNKHRVKKTVQLPTHSDQKQRQNNDGSSEDEDANVNKEKKSDNEASDVEETADDQDVGDDDYAKSYFDPGDEFGNDSAGDDNPDDAAVF